MTCRICYEDEPTDKLISVCACRGTLEFVHEECIIQWIRTSRRSSCEICHERYNISPIFYSVNGIMCTIFGGFVAISHAVLLQRQVDKYPNDFYSVVILAILANSLQFLIWLMIKKEDVLILYGCVPLWFFTYLPLTFILQHKSYVFGMKLISWIPTTIFYLCLSLFSWYRIRPN